MSRQYITTAIDYPNAAPHMGHVLEKVLADVLARWFRLRGDEVRFQIGTDEHGIKIQQTAEKEKMTPKKFVDRNVPFFQELYAKLGISADVFMRTSDQEMHWPTVQELWKRLQKAGVLEKRTYTGLYCTGCERFLTKKDLVDGKCENHQKAPEEVKEENWFFTLSKETGWLKELLQKEYKILPRFRENETLALLEAGLEDVSFSRPKTSLSWGIPVPEDEQQTMYVWCDALTNYISGLDYFDLNADVAGHAKPPAGGEVWWDAATVTHVIGKDIARFHALIWPAMLRHAGIRAPDRLLIHGFLTSDGEKMSKSLGNVVKPEDVLAHFDGNPDPLRFYLSHEVPVGNDGDFSWKRIDELYQSKLCNNLGNLLNRVMAMLSKEGGDLCVSPTQIFHESVDEGEAVSRKTDSFPINNFWDRFSVSMETSITEGIWFIFQQLDELNRRMNVHAPWSEKDRNLKKIILSNFAENLRHLSLMLLPFIPETAQKMSLQLGVPYAEEMLEKRFVIKPEMKVWGSQKDWKRVGEPSILFPMLGKKSS